MQFILVACAIFQSVMISITSATIIPDHPSPGAAMIHSEHDLNPSNSLKQSHVFGGIWKKYRPVLSQQRSALDKESHKNVLKDSNTNARHLESLVAPNNEEKPSGLMEVRVKESSEAQTLPMQGFLKRSLTSSHRSTAAHAEISRIIPNNAAQNAQKHLLVGK